MKQGTLRRLAAATVFAVFAASLGGAVSQAGDESFDAAKNVITPAQDIVWIDVNPAIRFGHGYGDRSREGHGTFGTFPPNFQTPFHSHTHAYHAVVLEGTMTNPFGAKLEENPPEMGPGSYWYVAAGEPHATACVSDTPCKFYMHGANNFDFLPLE